MCDRFFSRRHGLGVPALLLASLVSPPASAINVEFQASGVTILAGLSDVEMEKPTAVQGRQVLEFRDADNQGSPDWTPSGTVEGSTVQAWLRDAGASLTTTTTVAAGALSIQLQGDDNDGRCDVYVGGSLKATIDMNNVGVTNVQVIVDGLASNTYTIVIDDLGDSATGTGNDDCAVWGAAVLTPPPVLDPGDIGHVIVLMMENRSFDHSLGWVSGADGHLSLPTATYNTEPDGTGSNHQPAHLTDFQGCANADPGHTHDAGRCQWHGGAVDGWLFEDPPVGDCTTGSDTYAIGYYLEADLDFYSGVADNWTVFDNYFAAIMAGTFANKMFQYAADTDRLNTGDPFPDPQSGMGCVGLKSQMPTILDLLDGASVSWRYYFVDTPFLALWGTKYKSNSSQIDQFYDDAEADGQFDLPAVSFIDPRFLIENIGTSIDDHPKADVRAGQKFINDVYEAVVGSDEWTQDGDVVFVVTYDEWGGFFDHVDPKAAGGGVNPPQGACQANLEAAYGLSEPGLRGFRMPVMVISPWAPRGSVNSELFDATSILKMIEWNWGLANLNDRDLTATNLANALTAAMDKSAPSFVIDPALSYSHACPGGGGGRGPVEGPLRPRRQPRLRRVPLSVQGGGAFPGALGNRGGGGPARRGGLAGPAGAAPAALREPGRGPSPTWRATVRAQDAPAVRLRSRSKKISSRPGEPAAMPASISVFGWL